MQLRLIGSVYLSIRGRDVNYALTDKVSLREIVQYTQAG